MLNLFHRDRCRTGVIGSRVGVSGPLDVMGGVPGLNEKGG